MLWRSNRVALYKRAKLRFVLLLLLPSAMDVLVTGSAMAALVFVSPSLVGLLKGAVQLLVLAAVTRWADRASNTGVFARAATGSLVEGITPT